jgi:hypothetical protein
MNHVLEGLWWLADLIGLALTFILPSSLTVYREYHLTLPHLVLVPLCYGLIAFAYGPRSHWLLWRFSEFILAAFLLWHAVMYILSELYPSYFYPRSGEENCDDDDSDDE